MDFEFGEIDNDFDGLEEDNNFSTNSNESFYTEPNCLDDQNFYEHDTQTIFTQENIFSDNDIIDNDVQTVSTQENIFGEYNALESDIQVASTQSNIFGTQDIMDSSQNIASTQNVEEINPQPENSFGNLLEKCATKLSDNINKDSRSFNSEKGFTRVGYTQPNIFGGYDYYSCFSGNSKISPVLFSSTVLDAAKNIFNSLTEEVITDNLKDK